jgi:beta-phosphoglucomutase-like phosphatase (HAD superfamily)
MHTPAIIWDVDGTLVDTAEQHFRAWSRLAAEIGQPFTRADFAATFGMRNPEIIRKLFYSDVDDKQCRELGERKEDLYRASVREEGTQLLPGVAALLDAFAAAGWPQAVGSSAPPGNLDLLLGLTNTLRYFGAVVTGDDVRHGKPHPRGVSDGRREARRIHGAVRGVRGRRRRRGSRQGREHEVRCGHLRRPPPGRETPRRRGRHRRRVTGRGLAAAVVELIQ